MGSPAPSVPLTRCTAPRSPRASQAASSPALTSVGNPATSTAIGRFESGLIRFSVPASESATQT